MGDTISRQAAIELIERMKPYHQEADDIAEMIANMPSAQPERKKGRWEIYIISMLDGEGCRCSECGFEGTPYWDFCPNCGARMDGKGNG